MERDRPGIFDNDFDMLLMYRFDPFRELLYIRYCSGETESLEDRTRLVREKKRAELRVQLMRKLNRVIQEDSVYFRNRVKGAVEEQSQTN